MKFTIIAIMAVILFANFIVILSCTSNKLKEGKVVAKEYEPQNTFVAIMPLTISNGKTTQVMMIPYIINDNEDYIITICSDTNSSIQQRYYVSKEEYDATTLGEEKCFEAGCIEDNNNIKTKQ